MTPLQNLSTTGRYCTTLQGSSTVPAGQLDEVNISWGDGIGGNSDDDTRTVMIEIRHVSGPCDEADYPWTLKVTRAP
jgi:hypothetical protein